MSRSPSLPRRRLLLAIFSILAITLACGGTETAKKVGEVTKSEAITEQTTAEPPVTLDSGAATPNLEATKPTPQALNRFKVGDIIDLDDTELVVLGWDTVSGDEFTKPQEGRKFVAVDLLLVNQGTDSASVSSMLQMGLKDDTGQRYDIDLMASVAAGGTTPEGEISPGERLRGKVAFSIPTGATGLEFVFNNSAFGGEKVFVELGPAPVAVQPPEQLSGETEQKQFSVGDRIEIGDLVMTVNGVASPPGGDFNKPEEGNRFLVVDLTLENRGAASKAISSLLQMSVKDDQGQKYDVDLMASSASGGTTPDGDIAAGETIRGQVGFQVPVDSQGLVFVFDADVFGYGKLQVDLDSKDSESSKSEQIHASTTEWKKPVKIFMQSYIAHEFAKEILRRVKDGDSSRNDALVMMNSAYQVLRISNQDLASWQPAETRIELSNNLRNVTRSTWTLLDGFILRETSADEAISLSERVDKDYESIGSALDQMMSEEGISKQEMESAFAESFEQLNPILLEGVALVEESLSAVPALSAAPAATQHSSGPALTPTPESLEVAPKVTQKSPPKGKWTLVSDSVADFPTSITNRKWWYLWSEGRFNFRWQDMQQTPNDCAKIPSSYPGFICADRAGTDVSADIAVLWKPSEGGKYLLEWQTNPTKGSGDVLTYKHLDEIHSVGPGLTLPKSVVVDNVNAWEQFFFVVRSNGDPFETGLQIKAYRWQE